MNRFWMEVLSYLFAYLFYHSLPVYIFARKTEHPYAWLAFVPLANLWLLCDLAEEEWYWIIFLVVPFIDIVVYVILWMAIAGNYGKPSWLGLLMVLPLINIYVAYSM